MTPRRTPLQTPGNQQSNKPLVQYRHRQPLIQELESRKLLSSVLADGVLTVTGTSKKDAIVVSISSDGETISVSERTAKRFKKTTATKTDFAADDVTSVVINTGAGNDVVSLRSNRKTDFTLPSTIDGGDGDDHLSGGEGPDTINGDAGDDDLYGNGGSDLLNGGDGDDLINGGAAVDTLNGDAGDDLLQSAGDGVVDILDGGTDSAEAGKTDEDQAITDENETATNASVVDDIDVIPPPYGAHDGMGGHFGGFGFGPGGGHGHGHFGGGDDSSNSGTDTGTNTGTSTGSTTTTSALRRL